eukprot:RCo036328
MFLLRNPEKAELNQYWYSAKTIEQVVRELETVSPKRVAFVSTPSLFFSVSEEFRKNSSLLDYDSKWKAVPGFVQYDFNHPVDLPGELRGQFDYVVVDPPFITEEVWTKYAETVQWLLSEAQGGKVLCSTIAENAPMMQRLLGLQPIPFKPSIPHLVYQYLFYTNYSPSVLCTANPEIPED